MNSYATLVVKEGDFEVYEQKASGGLFGMMVFSNFYWKLGSDHNKVYGPFPSSIAAINSYEQYKNNRKLIIPQVKAVLEEANKDNVIYVDFKNKRRIK